MILVDTSVWIDHLRHSEKQLQYLLEKGSVLTHPLVIEELACGHLRDRKEIIETLHDLPVAPVATHTEVLELISNKTLYAVGLGAVDVHLIASAMLADAQIWSKDKALTREAKRLAINA
ncbi:MAG: type II toxin-antitoxin system VapC family toxin [Pyrinomonadaceae bacterium]